MRRLIGRVARKVGRVPEVELASSAAPISASGGRQAAWSPAARVAVGLVALVLIAVVVIVPAYLTVPLRNNTDPQVDCLVVLGSPTEIDGTLTAAQRWRVDEGVREFRAGRATHLLITGGRTSRGYIEAQTMGQYARWLGVPAAAILEEQTAATTRENILASERILDAHGWRRVEVISSPEHLPRTALLLRPTHLLWQLHAAPTPGRSRLQEATSYAEEATGTALIRCCGLGVVPVLHVVALVQHRTAFAVRFVFYKLRGWMERV